MSLMDVVFNRRMKDLELMECRAWQDALSDRYGEYVNDTEQLAHDIECDCDEVDDAIDALYRGDLDTFTEAVGGRIKAHNVMKYRQRRSKKRSDAALQSINVLKRAYSKRVKELARLQEVSKKKSAQSA